MQLLILPEYLFCRSPLFQSEVVVLQAINKQTLEFRENAISREGKNTRIRIHFF
jgi:hypothetical protein